MNMCRAGGGQNSGAAPQRRKSATVSATATEVQPPRRTRSANAPMSAAGTAEDDMAGQAAASPGSHLGMTALLAAATGGKSITHHAVLEQISVLHAQPQTEETKQYLQQLQAMLQVRSYIYRCRSGVPLCGAHIFCLSARLSVLRLDFCRVCRRRRLLMPPGRSEALTPWLWPPPR